MTTVFTTYIKGRTPSKVAFGHDENTNLKPPTGSGKEADNFYLNFDPKSLFDKENPPSGIRVINLNETTSNSFKQSKGITPSLLTKLTPDDNASPIQTHLYSEGIFQKTQVTNNKQDAIKTGTKLALLGIGFIAGGYLLANGISIGGVLVTDPSQLMRFATLFLGVVYGIAEVASKFLANPSVSMRIQDIFRAKLQPIRASLNTLPPGSIQFQGSQQRLRQLAPSTQILNALFNVVEEACTQLDSTQDLSKQCATVLDMEMKLIKKMGQVISQAGKTEHQTDVQNLNLFLENHHAYCNQLPDNVSSFKGVPEPTKDTLKQTLFYALTSPCPEISAWGQSYARQIGISPESIQAITKLRS